MVSACIHGLLFWLCTILCASAVHSGWMGTTENVTRSASQKQDIQRFIEDVMECYQVPGLTLAVVGHDGDDWWEWTDSFGKASDDDDDDVTTQTLFNIGSTTKAFTSTLLAILLEESNGRYTWETPIRDILGDSFLLGDEYRTKELTLVDMLSHRVGIEQHDFLWVLGFITERDEILKRLHLIGEAHAFRTAFYSNNLMYALAGRVAEVLGGGGKTWQQLVQEKIFDPLEMTSSNFLETMGPDYDGLARVQYLINGSLVQMDMSLYEPVKSVAATGSIVSNAEDMAKWLTFQLSGGKNSKNQSLISKDALLFTHQPQISVPYSAIISGLAHLPTYPVSEVYNSYGLGWFQGHYRGYGTSRHGGSLMGYESLITLQKLLGFGVYTSMNGPMTVICTIVESLIHMFIMDVAMDVEPWLDKESVCSFPKKWQPDIRMQIYPGSAFSLNKTAVPSRDLQDFAGTYASYLYGDLELSADGTENRLEAVTKNRAFNFVLYPTGEEDVFQSEILGTKSFFDRSDQYSTMPAPPTQVKFKTKDGSNEIYQMELWIGGNRAIVFEKGLDSSKPPEPDFVNEGCIKGSASVASQSLLYTILWCYSMTILLAAI